MPTIAASKTALVQSSARIDPELIAKHTGAVQIRFAKNKDNWLYGIECGKIKRFDTFSTALKAIETDTGHRFMRILDDNGSSDGKIMLDRPFPNSLESETWRQTGNELLIPGLKRLSKQLKVDFAYNVHDAGDGKRKRETTMPKKITKPRQQRAEKPKPQQQTEKPKKTNEDQPKQTDESIIVQPNETIKQTPEQQPTITSFAQKALEAVTKSHADTIAAKDETIRALTAALVAKDELIDAQAELMRTLQR